ncbi:hypothetical protein SAMN05428959_105295 [Duganella sp. CF517]|uniref:IncQ-type mobilization protein MobB n=1 Tax=Duganella sp. CF517 TaxID=1881038 RepID=UPI0008B1457D|nr:hypothetical protein SAMN05428959_105295 [Duganella sp. CF517]
MSKTETMKQLAAVSNEARVQALHQQIESLREAKLSSVDELASLLEPLAKAMAVLTQETLSSVRKIEQIEQRSRDQNTQFKIQMEGALTSWKQAVLEAEAAVSKMGRLGENSAVRTVLTAVLTGLFTGLLSTASWLLLAR